MRRIPSLVRILWLATGCGRIGFGTEVDAKPASLVVTGTVSTTTTCGLAPAPVALTITNPGGEALAITAATPTNGFTLDAPVPPSLAPGASVTVQIRPPAAVIGTDIGGTMKTGMLTFDTSAGPMTVPLAAQVVGANLDLEDNLGNHATLAFSSGTCFGNQFIWVVNHGNAPATAVRVQSSSYAASGFTSGAVDAFASSLVGIRPVTNGPCSGQFQVAYIVTGDVCSSGTAFANASFTIASTGPCVCS